MYGFTLGDPSAQFAASTAEDDIARFLTRVLPTPGRGRALGIHFAFQNPEDKLRVANGKTDKDGNPLTIYPGRAFHDVAEAVAFVRRWQGGMMKRGTPNVDFYTCMSLCGMETVQTKPDGRVQYKPTRLQNAMMASKALYADLDVKPDGYASQQDALDHIDQLVAAGSLPPPTIRLNSGRGIHLHWALDRELNRAEWYVLGVAWAGHLTKLGIHHDSGVAADGVRILRLPGTFNCKDINNPLPTSIIGTIDPTDVPVATFEALLGVSTANAKAMPAQRAQSQAPGAASSNVVVPASFTGAPVAPLVAGAELSSGIDPNEHVGQPVNFEEVVANCPTLLDIHTRGGQGDSEPLWSLAILSATFAPATEARDWAHDFSDGDPRYSEASTDAKFDQKLYDRQRSGGRIGWPTCKAFSVVSARCATCPTLALGKTPFHIAKDDSDMPEGYYRRGGQIMTQTVDAQGNESPTVVLPYGILDAYMESSPSGSVLNAEVVHVKNPSRRLVLPIVAATSWRDAAIVALGSVGVALLPAQLPLARNFFVSFIHLLQSRQADVASRESYGWTKTRNGATGFAFGGRVYTGNGEPELAHPGDRAISNQFRAQGDIRAWKQAADLVLGMKRLDIQAIVASAFAAPLVKFSGQTGVIFSAYNPESGVQKSTAMKVALSVWGNPIGGMSRLDDTTNHVGKKLGQLRHLPVFWDEVQTDDGAQAFAKLGFALTLGTEKGRMGADTHLRESGSWATMLTVASNPSIREIMLRGSATNSAAGVNRILEMFVERVPLASSAAASGIVIDQTHDNYGLAGALYAELLAREAPRLPGRLQKVMESLEQAVKATPEERFWILAASTILLGAALANTLDGGRLLQFDLAGLRALLVSTITKQRAERARDVIDFESTEFAVMVAQDYISACRAKNECLETDTVPSGVGRPKPVELRMPSQNAAQNLRTARLHVIHDDGLVRMMRAEFREWVTKERKLPFDVVRKALTAHAGMTEIRSRWAPGTPWAGAAQTFYQLDLGKTRTTAGAMFDFGPTPTPTGVAASAGGTP